MSQIIQIRHPGILLAIILSCLLIYTPESIHAQDTFSINTADKPPYSSEENNGLYDLLISHIFNEIGVAFQINHLKSARSIENVDLGIDDGEFARIKGLSSQYPNLEIVDEKLVDFAFTAFSKNPDIRLDGWNSLQGYTVAFLRGWKIYEKNVKSDHQIHIVASENELFKMLTHDRVDVILYEKLRGYDYMKKNSITGVYGLEKPLSVRGMYLYVNSKHSALIPSLEKALQAMKASGEYQKLLNSFLK